MGRPAENQSTAASETAALCFDHIQVPTGRVLYNLCYTNPMIALLFALLCNFILLDGYLSQYDQNPTDATIAYRQELGQIPQDLSEYAGMIAVEDCRHVGKDAYLYVYGHDAWFRTIVADCLGRDVTPNWMQANNVIAEMGYYLTQDLGYTGQGGIDARLVIVTNPGG